MSLILGVNLPQYLYLVSDTRLTRKINGADKYQDNFCKFYCFNENISVVVAGNAYLANYILRKFGESELVNKGFLQIEAGIEQFIKKTVDEYLKEGNKYAKTVLIFAGFDKSTKKQINTSHYGKTLAESFVSGEKQSLNKEIVREMIKAAVQDGGNGEEGMIGGLKKDQVIKIDYPFSSILTVEVNLPDQSKITKTECYRYVMKAPNKLSENNLSSELAYKLEQEGLKHNKGENVLKFQSITLTAWVDELIRRYKLKRVGGSIMVNMITPEGAIIAVGAVSALDKKTGKVRKVSEITVHQNRYCVRNEKDKFVPLDNIYDFNKDGEFEL